MITSTAWAAYAKITTRPELPKIIVDRDNEGSVFDFDPVARQMFDDEELQLNPEEYVIVDPSTVVLVTPEESNVLYRFFQNPKYQIWFANIMKQGIAILDELNNRVVITPE